MLELEGNLDHSREVGIWCAAKHIPGVHSVTDLSAVSQQTLDVVLFRPPPEPLVVPEPVVEQIEADWW